jgi:hypothetical protein
MNLRLVKAIATGATLATLVTNLLTSCSGKPAEQTTTPTTTAAISTSAPATVPITPQSRTTTPATPALTTPYTLENRISLEPGNAIVTNFYQVNAANFQEWKDHDLKYIFVDIGSVNNETGKLNTIPAQIDLFMKNLKAFEQKENYNFIVMPWVVAYAESSGERAPAKFSSAEFRANHLADFKKILDTYGFDGWLNDIEAIRPEDRSAYIQMNKDFKAANPGKILAAYAGAVRDDGFSYWTWSPVFVKDVAQTVDVLTTQGYDIGYSSKDAYQNFMKSQLDIYAGQQWPCGILWFVPSHKADNPLEPSLPNNSPETLENALEVYKANIGNYPGNKIIGIGNIWSYTMSKAEWITWDNFVAK